MDLSDYQQDIIDWAKTGKGHGCCNAVAGSGKSTTLRLVAEALATTDYLKNRLGYTPSEIKICVFGKANATDLIAKFGNQWKESISTLHSAGWSLIKSELKITNTQGLVKSNKYKQIAQELGFIASRGNSSPELRREGAIAKDEDFVKLLDLVRLTNSYVNVLVVGGCISPETVQELCLHFEIADIYDFEKVSLALAKCIIQGIGLASKGKSFDFTDQVWLPVLWELSKRPWFKPYQFVLVDECQDLNAAQLELVKMLAGSNGRILAVGDPRQAIMGFAGADNRSYQKIVDRLGATELPLSICYRCPTSHLELVSANFPNIPIEAPIDAVEGKIESIAESDLWSDKPCKLQIGDMVLCRKTAPLVNLCIKLIARGIAATVKGRAIGEQLKAEIEEISKISGFRMSAFNNALEVFRSRKAQKYSGLDNEEQLVEALNDKIEALQVIYQSQPNATCIKDLTDYIDGLFSDENSPITLSTCHRAKGLEGDRIFILKPEDMPMVWRNQLDWQYEQEENLLYVALTRSKSELYVVGSPSWLIKPVTEEIKTDALISMPAITLHQPWASLIAQGIKQFETRSWGTTYRGRLAIHAGKKYENDNRLLSLLDITQEQVALGAIVAFVDLIDCIEITESFASQQSDTELMSGDWSITEPARYAWRLENVEILDSPIPATGKQGIWNWCNRNKIEIVAQPSQPNVAVADIETTHKLADLESTIERGFAQAADALRQIRDLKLYEEYGTFADYCEHRWGFSDRYARNLLKASEVLTNLSIGGTNGSDLPTNERQIRPLANLEPEQQKAAWEDARAEAAASGEKVSGKHVANAVTRKKTGTGDSERRAASSKSPVIPAVNVEIVDSAVLQVEQSLASLTDADLNQIIDLVSAEILKRKK